MTKFGDFGGLPDSRFDAYIEAYTQTLTSLTDAQRIEVLKALAEEEHAAAKSDGTADLVSVAVQCVEIEEQHRKIVQGGTNITAFTGAIDDLANLW